MLGLTTCSAGLLGHLFALRVTQVDGRTDYHRDKEHGRRKPYGTPSGFSRYPVHHGEHETEPCCYANEEMEKFVGHLLAFLGFWSATIQTKSLRSNWVITD